MQTLCFIGNKKPPCGVDLQGGMHYRRDYVGCRTAALHLSSSSLQIYEIISIFFWPFLLNFGQILILFCSNTDTLLLAAGFTDTFLLFRGPAFSCISSIPYRGGHTWQSSCAGTWPRLQPKSKRKFSYTHNAYHPILLHPDPQERGSRII